MPQSPTNTLIHFSGFEPQSADEQSTRLIRSVEMSANAWGFTANVDKSSDEDGTFRVTAKGDQWQTETNAEAVSIGHFVNAYAAKPMMDRLITGYGAFFKLFISGAWFSYLRHVWRFALFALFPFLFFGLGVALFASIGLLPLLWSALPTFALPITLVFAAAAFRYIFLPYCNRIYVPMQFDDWRFAKKMAEFTDFEITEWVDREADRLAKRFLNSQGDITITSHSMGGVVAAQVIGAILEKAPEILNDRQVYFVQLGGAVMQSAWIRPATVLRSRVGLIAHHKNITWLEVQCLTDPVNFYKCDPPKLCGFDYLPPVPSLKIRFKNMLELGHYKRIQFDIMRMHRQFIIGPDKQSPYDFGTFAFGPLSPEDYITASQQGKLAKELT